MVDHTLAVITVIYENYTILDDYFASFEKQTDTDFALFVVDLSENKKEYLFPSYAALIKDKNKGYAYGINLGVKQALLKGYTSFCIMNCDTTVRSDFVKQAKKSIATHPHSLIGGKIYYSPGYEYHKDRYEKKDLGNVLWYGGGVNDWKNCLTLHRGVDEIDKKQYDIFGKTQFITGCLICYDKGVFEKLGGWDEGFFLYYEDADYCERAKKQKIPLYYDPSIVLWHKNASSTGGSGSQTHIEYQKKNQLTFGIKYAPYKTKLHLVKNYISFYLSTICKCDQ